jgi:hypothetical protein
VHGGLCKESNPHCVGSRRSYATDRGVHLAGQAGWCAQRGGVLEQVGSV